MVVLATIGTVMMWCTGVAAENKGLWGVYESALKGAKYVDLTHTITPDIPVWSGFGESHFAPAEAGSNMEGFAKEGDAYTYGKHGFEATTYTLRTDQLGTQLDPPAYWAPEYPAIDELRATYAIRPLVVISIVEQLKMNPNYALQVSDIRAWDDRQGRIPQGSVVFVRSDWSKAWPDPRLATFKEFPGVGLEALKFLHNERKILFHGHESLATDSTPNLEGEYWLMHNGYTQAEGVANLDEVPEIGALVIIGYPKFGGGLGGYACHIAVCPPDWPHGVTIGPQDTLCRNPTSRCTMTLTQAWASGDINRPWVLTSAGVTNGGYLLGFGRDHLLKEFRPDRVLARERTTVGGDQQHGQCNAGCKEGQGYCAGASVVAVNHGNRY